MGMQTVISFQVAIAKAEGKKHVLLGNGFSRACLDYTFEPGNG